MSLCFTSSTTSTKYPLILGGQIDNTYITSLDVHEGDSTVAIGGKSSEDTLVPMNYARPFIAVYDYSTTPSPFLWGFYFGCSESFIQQVAWSKAGNYLIATQGSDIEQFTINVIYTITPQILKIFKTGLYGMTLTRQGLLTDGTKNIFIGVKNSNLKWTIIGFHWDSSTMIFQKQTPYATSQAYALQFYNDFTNFLVFGNIVDSSNTYFSMIQFSSAGSQTGYNLGFRYQNGYQLVPNSMKHYSYSSKDYFYYSLLNQADDQTAYFVRIIATDSNTIDSTDSLQYSSSGNGMYVYECYADSTNTNYLYTYLSYTTVGQFYFAKVDFGTSKITLTYLDYVSNVNNYFKAAIIISSTKSFYLIDAKLIKGSSQTLTSQYIGVVMVLNPSKSCQYQEQTQTTESMQSFSLTLITTLAISFSSPSYSFGTSDSSEIGCSGSLGTPSTTINCYVQNAVTLSTPSDLTDITYVLYMGSQSYQFSDFTLNTTCSDASILYNATIISSAGTLSALPSFVTFDRDNRIFQISTNTLSDVGTYSIQVTAQIQQSFFTSYKTINLNVVVCTVTASNVQGSYTYILGQTQSSIPFDAFTTSHCTPDTITYSLTEANGQTISNFLSLSNPRTIQIYTTAIQDIGTYYIQIAGEVTITPGYQFSDTTDSFKIEVINNNQGGPEFNEQLEDQEVYAGVIYTYKLPKATDPDNDGYTIDVSLGKASKFTKYKQKTFTMSPTIAEIGKTYQVNIILTDDNQTPLSTQYAFKITVKGTDYSNTSNTTANNQTSTTTAITEVYTKQLTAKIKSISQRGEVVVKFNNHIIVPANYSDWNYFNDSALKLIIIPSDSQNTSYLNFTWSCKGFTSKLMTLQLNFSTPEKISELVISITFQYLNLGERLFADIV